MCRCQAGGYPVRLGAIVSSALLAKATQHRLAALLSALKMRLVGSVLHGLPLFLKTLTSNLVQSSQERGQSPWPASEIASANTARQQLEEVKSGDGFTCRVCFAFRPECGTSQYCTT